MFDREIFGRTFDAGFAPARAMFRVQVPGRITAGAGRTARRAASTAQLAGRIRRTAAAARRTSPAARAGSNRLARRGTSYTH